jgi:hypothetical protein
VEKPPGLEFEAEAELGAVGVSKRCARSLSTAVALRLAKSTAVEVRVDVVTGIIPVPDVVHFPDHAEFHVLADLEGIRSTKVKFDKWFAAEAVHLQLFAAEGSAAISASAVDRGAPISVDVEAGETSIGPPRRRLKRGSHFKAIRQHENTAGSEAIALIEVGGAEFTTQVTRAPE